MEQRYPSVPEPLTVEIELTNHCNASCQFCPHPRMTREKGFMQRSPYQKLLHEIADYRNNMWINSKMGNNRFPRIVFAGLGDPLIHPDASIFVRDARELDFPVQLVTNGLRLTEDTAYALKDANLSSLAISLHTLNPQIYNSLMRLDLKKTLPRIHRALEIFADSETAIELWRVLPPPGQPRESPIDEQAFQKFIEPFPKIKVLGPSEPWERDGTVPNSVWQTVKDSDEIWCHKIFFTSNVAWDGTGVMCCVDYHRVTVDLGNVFAEGFLNAQRRREKLYTENRKIPLCAHCRRWKDTEYEQNVLPQFS